MTWSTYFNIDHLIRYSERATEGQSSCTIDIVGHPENSFRHFTRQGISVGSEPFDAPMIAELDAMTDGHARQFPGNAYQTMWIFSLVVTYQIEAPTGERME